MSITLYGIPTCGTVKKARKWLDAHQVAYEWVDTRQAPPAEARIRGWIEALGFKPLRNTSGGAYRARGPDKKQWGAEQWLPAFAADAMLLKRPVVEVDGQPVTVGFKEPVYQELFGG